MKSGLEKTDSTSPPSPESYPVVLVEDDPNVRSLMQRLLTTRGYHVHPHAEAETALERLSELSSSVLVTDRMLPGMTGVDLIEHLRETSRDFEAILVTAYADVESLARSVKLGIFRCILKPFHNEDLLAAVAGAANRLRLRLDLRARTLELETRNAELERTVERLHGMEKRRTLEERMASIGRLAAGVAHEINSPLAAVIANLEVVTEDLPLVVASRDPQRQRRAEAALADAREGAERVRVVVRDLKAFSRSDDEKTGPVDLQRVVEATLSMVRNEIRHRARVVKDFAPAGNVLGNEARLGQLVLNLLLNAAQAIPEGNALANEIRVVIRAAGDRVVLEVHDTGTGIASDVIDRVFEPFFTTKPIGMGTGLGLSISHDIVTSLGGRIEVESEPDRGTLFRVLLPATEHSKSTAPPLAPRAPEPRARVLAIDDDELILSALSRILRDCDVVAVTSARDALDRIGSDAFDVILCDLMMPQMTGMELHGVLANAAPHEAEKMIFMTGGTFTPNAQTFLDSVTNEHIEKPFDARRLRAIIRNRLRGPLLPSTPSRE